MIHLKELSLGRVIKHVNDAGNDIIKQYDKRIALRKKGQTHDPEYEKSAKRIVRREKGIGMAANAFDRFTKKNVHEDAPINNVGGGAIAGLGVGPNGEPGVPKNKQARERSTPTSVVMGMLRRKAPSQLAEDTFAGECIFC